ncbi:hypothetical protein [Pseudomonas sp. R3-41]
MLKNVLATIGLAVVLKASFDLYLKYKQMSERMIPGASRPPAGSDVLIAWLFN